MYYKIINAYSVLDSEGYEYEVFETKQEANTLALHFEGATVKEVLAVTDGKHIQSFDDEEEAEQYKNMVNTEISYNIAMGSRL
jgi:hypothetical protein